MMSGYFRNEAASHAFRWRDAEGTHFHRTGDIGLIDDDGFLVLLDREMDIGDAFPNQRSFNEAVVALVRFGFTYMGSAWDSIALSITARGLNYIDNLDLECMDAAGKEGL